MELRHLRYFAAVAETRHFGRAAERLHMAQPALSQAIRQLEAELGAALLTRTTRQVALTPAGEFLLGEARRVLDTLDDSVRGVRRIAAGRLGQVRLGFTSTATLSHLPGIARALRRELPGVVLEVHSDLLTADQCERLRTGDLDLGILRPPVIGDGLGLRTLEIEPLMLAVPADHRLAHEPAVAMADLRDEDFLLYANRESIVNAAVLRSARAAGYTPRTALEGVSTGVLLALVAGGLGIAVVPASARALALTGVVFRDLPDAESVELALAWRRDSDSELVRSVLGVLAAELPDPLPPVEVDR
ncbi:LysR substrate-binding domain-containing protein [Nocardia farcinica]|uniref:LysR substrate-binding domain-containing protein n=1 Tax=Nocardia farcinica TaxID=37329 RepID=UPI001895FA5F|nr:LysR substrate-binding domain-containing protein [Nocardia farcinica]MBF6291343.1 LysR family transcriptional regulator [Nocardia farcinica]MBF6378368.1 LysR family transcriptional regulator [Nocardia farcinica]